MPWKVSKLVTQAELRKLLNYDANTGVFTWRVDGANYVRAGMVAGTPHGRYLRISINRRHHFAHVLAWLYVHGARPNGPIDHVNNDGRDNRIANLRPATHGQNKQNSKTQRNNTTGAKGVLRHGERWKADIGAHGKRYHLGVFDTFEEALSARRAAEAELHGAFAFAA